MLISCMPQIRFDQTCITCIKSMRYYCKEVECPKTFMIGNQSLVTIIETGENIYLNYILRQEYIQPRSGIKIAIAKLNGKIYLTGEEFNNLWILYPEIENRAKLSKIKLPLTDNDLHFNIYDNLLMVSLPYYNKTFLLIDDFRWEETFKTKPGAR